MRVFTFDTETTDLVGNDLLPLAKQPHIIEFAGILADVADDGTITELQQYQQLFYPGFDISADTTRMTNISREMLQGQPRFDRHAVQVVELMFRSEAYCGHNLMFDYRMVQNEFRRCVPPLAIPQRIMLCTSEVSEYKLGKRSKLTDLYAHLTGCALTGAHRAMNDAAATLACLGALKAEGFW